MSDKSEVIVLGEVHTSFARSIDDLLAGRTVLSVEYHGLDPDPENEAGLTLAEFETRYPEIDTLDYGLMLRTDQGHFHITWDSTFFSYGVIVTRLSDDDPKPSYGTTIEASHRPQSSPLIGKVILGADIIWDRVMYTNSEESHVYPQWLRIRHSEGAVYLSASEILRDDLVATGFMDNILVTSDRDMAIRILQFPHTSA
jgi:hypothetical protein